MFTASLACFFALFVAVLFFWSSFGLNTLLADPAGPAIVPRLLSIIIAVAAVAEGAKLVRLRRSSAPIKQTLYEFTVEMRAGLRAERSAAWRVAVVMGLCLIYPTLMRQTGFILSSFVLILIVSRICALTWPRTVAMAVTLPVLIQIAFGTLLGARIPRGALIDLSQIF